MRIVHTADWHIGKSLNDYSLLTDQRFWFERFTDRLEQLRPDALIVAGDLYDRSVPSGDAVDLLNEILRRIVLDLHIETFLIAGNHDSGQRLGFGSELLEEAGLHIAGTVAQPVKEVALTREGQVFRFFLLPYVTSFAMKRFYPDETIKTQEDAVRLAISGTVSRLCPGERSVLISHGFFSCGRESDNPLPSEVSAGGSELVDASCFRAFDYVALGHLHGFRTAGTERTVYSGSPLKYSVDEAGQEKSFCVVELDGNGGFSLRRESIPPLRDVRIVEGPFAWLADRTNHSHREDYIFARLTDTQIVLNAISRLKAVFPHILGLQYIHMLNWPENSLAKSEKEARQLSPMELFGAFYRSVLKEDLSPRQAAAADAAFAAVTSGEEAALQEGS